MITKPNLIITPPPNDKGTGIAGLSKQPAKPSGIPMSSFGSSGANQPQLQKPQQMSFPQNKPNQNQAPNLFNKFNQQRTIYHIKSKSGLEQNQVQEPMTFGVGQTSMLGGQTQGNTQGLITQNELNTGPVTNMPSLNNTASKVSSLQKVGGNRVQKQEKPLSQYSKSYNKLGPFDILNEYYHILESPQDFKPQTIPNISNTLLMLIKHKPESMLDFTVDKIKLVELANVPEKQANPIKNFFLSVIVYFMRDHPYCSFEGVLQLLQFHIKQNKAVYYPDGNLNIQLFKQHNVLDGNMNQLSQFFINIQNTLQIAMTVFVNQFCSIVKSVPKSQAHKLMDKQQIVTNVMTSFKNLYNADYVFVHMNYVHQQMAFDLINILLAIHRKNPELYKISFLQENLRYFDQHFYLISRNLKHINPLVEDKSISTIVGKRCIQFVNLLVLKHPLQRTKWDVPFQRFLGTLKSELMYPFKWMLVNNKRSTLQKRTQRQLQLFNQLNYFTLLGREWLPLLMQFIKNEIQNQYIKINEYYKDMIFYLLCSVIEENPYNFWTAQAENQLLYRFINDIFKDIKDETLESAAGRIGLGQLCRIMLCACGKPKLNQISNDISQQLYNNFKQDSVMLRSLKQNQHQTSSNNQQLSNYVFHYFVKHVIANSRTSNQQLFGYVMAVIVQSSETDQQQYLLYDLIHRVDPPKLKYHYELPTVAYQLIIRLINDNPMLIHPLSTLFNREYQKIIDSDHGTKPTENMKISIFLQKITFEYIIKVEQYCFARKNYNRVNQQADKITQYFQVIPIVLQLLNNLLRHQQTKQVAIYFLQQEHIYNDQRLRQILQKSTTFQANVDAIGRHIQIFYQLDLNHIPWISRTCSSIIKQAFDLWQIDVVKHYANIVRIVITSKYLSPNAKFSMGWSNLLSLDLRNEIVGSSLKSADSYNLRIPQLDTYAQYLLPFIVWALKIQEDNLRQFYFYNTLYINKKYDTLGSALKLLQVLMVIYIRYHDRIYMPQKLRRFLSIFNTSNQYSLSTQSLTSGSTTNVLSQQIQLSNNKVATLPAVLGYLIAAPKMISASQFKEHNSARAKQVRSIAINILTIMMASNNSTFSLLANLQENGRQVPTEDSIANINFNVYQSMFVNEYQKAYCSAKQFLINYIQYQICDAPKNVELTPLPWFQHSYNYGQLIDLVTQMSRLFASPKIQLALVQRIQPQLKQGAKLGTDARRMLTKLSKNNSIYSILLSTQLLPSQITCYQCDREITAYSRYALQLAIFHSPSSTGDLNQHLLMIMNVIANRLLELIIEQPDCEEKEKIIQSISINMWRIIRSLQTKKNSKLFSMVLHLYMPFVLHYYHLYIKSPNYIRQYMIGIRLVLACKQYLPASDLSRVYGIDKLNQMLINLMMKTAQKPNFYTVLLYCLNFYDQMMRNQKMRLSELRSGTNNKQVELFENKKNIQWIRSVYNIVNQTLNPLHRNSQKRPLTNSSLSQRKDLNQLSKDVTIISLMMFFKIYIPTQLNTQNYTGQPSVYELLFNTNEFNSQVGFNFKSLLLNIQQNPTKTSIQMALRIGNNSNHYIQFVSACNHLYKALIQESTYQHEGLIQQILSFIQRILEIQGTNNSNQAWINLAYLKSWACNLLYVMMGYSGSETLISKISQIAFTSNNLLSLLGELLTIFGQCQIKWPWVSLKSVNMSKLGLLEKQLLHSILKVYMSLFSKVDKWNKRSGSQTNSKNTIYTNFCKAVIAGSRLLSINSFTGTSVQSQYGDRVLKNITISSSPAKTQYEQTLQKTTIQRICLGDTIDRKNEQRRALQQSKVRLIHPHCSSVLDLIHEHFNLMIAQKYLMMMQGAYLNSQLILETYQFNDILTLFELATKRLIQIDSNTSFFNDFMEKIHEDVWMSFRMNTNLYYLNAIDESPKDTVDILNHIAQSCINSIIILRGAMEMHQDYRQFYMRADKIMRQARKAQKVYGFQIKNYIQESGFDHKSQYGQSVMYSPSAVRIQR